jgi:hypothetical protein
MHASLEFKAAALRLREWVAVERRPLLRCGLHQLSARLLLLAVSKALQLLPADWQQKAEPQAQHDAQHMTTCSTASVCSC